MIRNCCDHGIESIEERLAAGKPESGTIHIEAQHEGGYILIEIIDDGRGINLEKVKSKAVNQGMLNEDQAARLSENQIIDLIFQPGFSTCDQVTNISGRGVGMDVVRSSIEKIGGTIHIHTEWQKGTHIKIKIPLTLAIISAFIVKVGDFTFAVPHSGVHELVRICEDNKHLLDQVHEAPVLRLREELIPVKSLASILDIKTNDTDEMHILILNLDDKLFGIVVDCVLETEEIVVKPMSRKLADLKLYSGTTILGNGAVIMILDIQGITSMFSPQSSNADTEIQTNSENSNSEIGQEKMSLLIFEDSRRSQQAIPLSLVSRLEEFEKYKFEKSTGSWVVQYRNELLPLISIEHDYNPREDLPQTVVVFSDGEKKVGLMIYQVIDIHNQAVKIEFKGQKQGVLGCAILNEKATEIIDVYHHLRNFNEDWFRDEKEKLAKISQTVLIVEDSEFFKNLILPIILSQGIQVKTAKNGSEALSILEAHEIHAVVTDIEMPVLNGFELLEKIRIHPKWKTMPVIALTGFNSTTEKERGLKAGFNDFVAKFNQEGLIQSLKKWIDK